MIRNVELNDAEALVNIYNWYIDNTTVTAETQRIDGDEMTKRISKIIGDGYPYLVVEDESSQILGYAYAYKFRERVAYNPTVELAIYLDHYQTGKAIGQSLYDTLLAKLREMDFTVALAAVAMPNEQSKRFHLRNGFKLNGYFNRLMYKFDQHLDLAIFELQLKA